MPVQLTLGGHPKDLGGGFVVRRILPAARRQAIGPFLFFDHFGPVTVLPESGHDVRPHPHIGLATVTYLFEGAVMHRDSLGCVQEIEPGAINWMTAGRGIVHSERRPERLQGTRYVNHGFQLWAALPQEFEEAEPGFAHTPAAAIPQVEMAGARVRVLVGEAFGVRSPVRTFSPTTYLDITLSAGGRIELPPLAQELAVYPVDADVVIDGQEVAAQSLAVLEPGLPAGIAAPAGARMLVLGGAPVGPRFMWWNFVSSSKDRIAAAAQDWKAQHLGKVPGETEWIEAPALRLPN